MTVKALQPTTACVLTPFDLQMRQGDRAPLTSEKAANIRNRRASVEREKKGQTLGTP
jgi:hypothetical protein